MSATTPESEARSAAGRAGGSRWLVPLGLFLGACALYGATRRAGTFSDAVQLAERVSEGPSPYYNALYIPLGWAFWRALAPVTGWDAWTALAWLSVVAGAASVALAWTLLEGVVRGPLARLAWCLLLALAPGVWFFAASVEVHALQLACVSAATLLAWRAREAPSARAPFLLAAGLVVASIGHLTAVLLLPALVLLALGREPGRGLAPRALPWRAIGAAAALLVLVALLVAAAFDRWGEERLDPLETLAFFASFLRRRVQEAGLFSAGEVLEFLRRELVAPAGVLVLCVPLALCVKGDRRLVIAVAAALVPYLLVLPQGGIREQGAYYLSLFPLVVLGAARALEERVRGRAALAGLALALVPQALLGARAARADGGGEDARVWARELALELPEGALVFTATLPRWHALRYAAPGLRAVDVWRVLEMMPASAWDGYAELSLAQARAELAAGARVFADVDLFRAGDRPQGVARLAGALEEAFPAPRPLPADDPLVLELALP